MTQSVNSTHPTPKHVAIIGSGITGLAAASFLDKQGIKVTMFEKDNHVGGHCYTYPCKYDTKNGKSVNVDLGFMVLNPVTYNNFIKWLQSKEYNIQFENTDMSFSACMNTNTNTNSYSNINNDNKNDYIEWSSNNIFSDPSNWYKKDIWRMIWDILRSEAIMYQELTQNKLLKGNMINDNDSNNFHPQTVQQFQEKYGLSDAFMKYFLLPQCGSIWSTPDNDTNDMPSDFLLTFMFKHQLNTLIGRPTWWTVTDRSQTYVQKVVEKHFGKDNKNGNKIYNNDDGCVIRLQFSDNDKKKENNYRISVISKSGLTTIVDHVLFVCHPKFAMKILNNSNTGATKEEENVLNHFDCGFNQVILHELSLLGHIMLCMRACMHGVIITHSVVHTHASHL